MFRFHIPQALYLQNTLFLNHVNNIVPIIIAYVLSILMTIVEISCLCALLKKMPEIELNRMKPKDGILGLERLELISEYFLFVAIGS
jgi:hypothetical protein